MFGSRLQECRDCHPAASTFNATAVSIVRNCAQLVSTRAEGDLSFTLSAVKRLNEADKLSVYHYHGCIRLSFGKEFKGRKYKKGLALLPVFGAFSID